MYICICIFMFVCGWLKSVTKRKAYTKKKIKNKNNNKKSPNQKVTNYHYNVRQSNEPKKKSCVLTVAGAAATAFGGWNCNPKCITPKKHKTTLLMLFGQIHSFERYIQSICSIYWQTYERTDGQRSV